MEFPSQPWGGALTSIQLAGRCLVPGWGTDLASTHEGGGCLGLHLSRHRGRAPAGCLVPARGTDLASTHEEGGCLGLRLSRHRGRAPDLPLRGGSCLHEQCWQATDAYTLCSSFYTVVMSYVQ